MPEAFNLLEEDKNVLKLFFFFACWISWLFFIGLWSLLFAILLYLSFEQLPIAPITLLLCLEFYLSILWFSIYFEHSDIPFFLEADRYLLLELACLLLHEILDSFKTEYLVFDFPISAGYVVYRSLVRWWEAVAVVTVVFGSFLREFFWGKGCILISILASVNYWRTFFSSISL